MSDDTGPARKASTAPARAGRRRRLAIRLGIGVAATALLFVLLVFVLPTPVARYVIESQLDSLGIQHDGIDTVDIDLWNSRVHAGPVAFRSGEAQDGQIGETGFVYSFGEVFKGRAFVQTFYLRGVDVYVTRLDDGAIAINGINLQEVAGPGEEAAQASPEEQKKESRFGFGGDSFEFTDSRLVFEDVSGGTLAMDLDRLTLERLRSWTPNEPTAFALNGRLNEIELALDGTIVPLGDPMIATLNTRTKGVTLDRIAKFIGPTGLAKQDGAVQSEVHYNYSIFSSGRIEGTVDGTYQFSGFDIATTSGETVKLDDATLKVDLRQQLPGDGSATASGQLRLAGERLAFANATGDAVEVGAIELSVDSLDMHKGTERRRRLIEQTAEADSMAETTPSIVELMIGWARELGRDALNHRIAIDGKPALTLKDGMLRLAARDGTAGQELRFDQAKVDLGEVASETFDAGVGASGALDAVVAGLRLAMQDGSAEAGLAEVRVGSRAIDFNITRTETKLAFDLAVELQNLTAQDSDGGTLDLSRLALATESFSIAETADSEEASGPVTLALENLAARLPDADGALALSGESLELNLAPLTLTGKQGEAGRIAGSLAASGLSLERGGQTPLAFSLAALRSELQDVSAAPLSAQATVAGNLATSLSGLRFEAGQGAETLSLTLETIENQAEGLEISGFDGEAPSVSLANRTRLSALAARLPIAGGLTVAATVDSLEAPLSELALAGAALRAKGAIEVTGIAAQLDGEAPQSLDLASLSLTGLDGDSQVGAAIEQIALGALNAKVSLPLPALPDAGAAAGEGETTATATAEVAAAESGGSPAAPRFEHQFKLGELTLAPGARIEIADKSLAPPLQTSLVVEELRLGPIDTAAPETRTDLALALAANETSKVSLRGWAAPFKAKPDFELASDVERLPLIQLSPYAAQATGVNVESGELSAGIAANASDAALAGNIDLRINDLFVSPLSDEEAERIKADIGLPVGFAVSILKDSEGVIAFGLPLSGTVDAPEVDYGEAIDKAISGAMASVFPTSWFGPDGNTFEMQPAPFLAGTTELTKEGREVADQMGSLFADKPGISIRACGRAGRADLVALRGDLPAPTDTVMPAGAPTTSAAGPAEESVSETAATRDAAGTPVEEKGDGTAAAGDAVAALPPPDKDIAAPSDAEIQALHALATERGAAVRKYLEAKYGIDPGQIPECRTTYSIEDGKLPRAEFQF